MKRILSVLLLLIALSAIPDVVDAASSTADRIAPNPLTVLDWGEACSDSISVPFADLPFCTTASSNGAVNNYPVPCVGGPYSTGTDVVYCLLTYGLPGVRTVTASLCGSGYDTALHIWRNRHPDDGGTLMGCSNSACGDDGCVTFLAEPDSFYYIIVDGGQSFLNSGQYTLNIHEGTDCAANVCEPLVCPHPNFDFEPSNNDTCNEAIPFLVDGEYCGTLAVGDPLDIYTITIPSGECRLIWIDIMLVREPGVGIESEAFDMALYRLGTCDPHYFATQIFPAFYGSGVYGWLSFGSYCLTPGTYQLHIVPLDIPVLPEGTRLDQYTIDLNSVLCECVASSFQLGDDEQANNSCAALNPNIVPGDTVSGTISNPGDVDWYRFDINGNFGQYVSIDVFGNDNPGLYTFGQGLDPKLFLFGDECQTMLINDDDNGTGSDARIDSFYLSPGSYSIKIEGNGSSGPYALATSCASCPCEVCPFVNRDDEQQNGTCGPTNPVIECGDKYCGEILNANDTDFYTFMPPQNACTYFQIKVYADDTPNQCAFGFGLDAAIDIYSADCGYLMYSDDFGGVGTDPVTPFSQDFPETAYHIAVRGSNGTSGRYIVEIVCTPNECFSPCVVQPQEGDIFEFEYCGFSFLGNGCTGESFSTYPIACGQSYFGYSNADETSSDTDWFEFTTAPTEDEIYFCLETTFDATMTIWAAGPAADPCFSRDLLKCKIAPQCALTCDTLCLLPGTYFAEVKPLAPYPIPCGNYRLAMNCLDCETVRPQAVEHLTIHYPDDAIVPDPDMNNIVLRWDAAQGADEYLIYRSTDPDPALVLTPLNLISITTNTFYIDEARIEHNGVLEQTYYVVVANFRTDAAPCSAE